MIIERLHAENVYKYTRLALTDLPPAALIGISGPNESGKSAIAEALCLALFGRTFSLGDAAIFKAIKWGSPDARLELRFLNPAGDRFTVTRYLDVDGHHSARLTYGESDTPVVQGVDGVTERLAELAGYTFEQYINAFYLAQREFSVPHAQSDMIRALLGIAELDAVADELAREADADRATLQELEQQTRSLRLRIADLDVDPGALGRLEQRKASAEADLGKARQGLNDARRRAAQLAETADAVERTGEALAALTVNHGFEDWRSQAAAFNRATGQLNETLAEPTPIELPVATQLEDWSANLARRIGHFVAIRAQAEAFRTELEHWLQVPPDQLDDAKPSGYAAEGAALTRESERLARRRGRARIGFALATVLALLGFGAWGVMTQGAGDGMVGDLHAWLTALPSPAGLEPGALLGSGAVAFLILALMAYTGMLRIAERRTVVGDARADLEAKAERARTQLALFRHMEHQSVTEQAARLRQLDTDPIKIALDAFAQGDGAVLMDGAASELYRAPMIAARERLAAARLDLRSRLETELQRAEAAVESQAGRLAEIEGAILDERARRDELAALERQIEVLQARGHEPQDRIAVRAAGRTLLQGTVRRVYTLFNAQMQAYLADLLPLFTDGRYRHLKIDEAFGVQVFAEGRNDFVALDDLSSGAQRQLILALRLALSQALVDSRVHGRQSLILDEPFAFFDRERMGQVLATLPRFSQEITQIFVISQEFQDTVPFGLHIRCARGSDELAASGG